MPISMPSFTMRSNPYRHIGFLNYNRRLLALGAITATGMLSSIQSLPASAEVVTEETEVSQLQSFVVPARVSLPPVERDSFGVTRFSVVQWPVPRSTERSSGWGYRSCYGCSSFHKGIDLVPGEGYPVEAIADGVVTEVGTADTGLGVHAIIEHRVDGETVSSLYAHMQYGSMNLHVGQRIDRGDRVGRVGNTGASTGPHLHFGILINGAEVDPLPWLNRHVNI